MATTTRPTLGGATGQAYSSTSTQPANSLIRQIEALAESLDFMQCPLTRMFGYGPAVASVKDEWTDERFNPTSDILNGAINSAVTALTATNGSYFQDKDIIQIDDELIQVNAAPSGNSLGTIVRGWGGTTAASHANGATIEIVGPAVPESYDAPAAPITRGDQFYNNCQIFNGAFQVSYRQNQAANYLIRGPEYDYEVQKKFKEMAVRLERTIFRGVRVDVSGANPSAMGGFPSFITTNTLAMAGAAFTEQGFLNLVQQAWRAVGPINVGLTVVCDIFAKRVFGSWGDGLRRLEAKTTGVALKLDTFETDMGTLELVPHYHCPQNRLYVIDPANFKIRPNKGNGRWMDEPLAKNGAYLKGHIYGDYTLHALGNRAHSAMTGFSTTAGDYPTMA